MKKRKIKGKETTNLLTNQKGMALLTTLIFVFILGTFAVALLTMTSNDTKLSALQRDSTKAFYIAEAGIQRSIKELKGNFGWRLGFVGEQLGDGEYTVEVKGYNEGDPSILFNQVRVTSTGTLLSNGAQRKIEVHLQKVTYSPVGVHGAITANGPIGTTGGITIDGRDHDINGNLTGHGLFGISTRSTYDQGGSSEVGGTWTDPETGSVTDILPTKSGFEPIIEEHATWSPPLTPDQALGLPEGTLKNYAQSGAGGSNYVTNGDSLTMPLSGVTYVELPSEGTWQAINFANSSGILVVHNSSTNAILKNTNGGTFRGIIIADDYIHIHDTIIGAVMTLTIAPSEGNTLGNGTGSVLYSRVAVVNTMSFFSGVKLVSWQEKY